MNIYYRIYKLYQRKIPIQQISVTTNIPVKTIKDLIFRFESGETFKDDDDSDEDIEPFLDYMTSKHHKYVVVNFSGMLTEQFIDKIKSGLDEAKQLPGQILAVKLDSIIELEDAAMKIIVDFKDKLNHTGKTVVILSPSELVEEYIQRNNIEENTKIFGTQNTFEDFIFRSTFDKKIK
jgi:anti-anti-sigma regulatory factor